MSIHRNITIALMTLAFILSASFTPATVIAASGGDNGNPNSAPAASFAGPISWCAIVGGWLAANEQKFNECAEADDGGDIREFLRCYTFMIQYVNNQTAYNSHCTP